MGYIGAQPATNFETVRKQVSTTNSGTTITLDFAVSSVQDILVTVNAVVQSYDNYSVSGTTLTLGGTLNNDRVEILYVGRTFQTVTPAVGTVTNDMLSGSIANSKLANSSITLNGSAVSLGGSATVGNTPYFLANRTSSQTLSNNAYVKVQFNNEVFDSANGYDPTTNYRYTIQSGQAGKYVIGARANISGSGDTTLWNGAISIYLNGSAYVNSNFNNKTGYPNNQSHNVEWIFDASVSDYFEVYIKEETNSGSNGSLISASSGDSIRHNSFYGYKLIT